MSSLPILVSSCFPAAVGTPRFSLIRVISILRTWEYLRGVKGWEREGCEVETRVEGR